MPIVCKNRKNFLNDYKQGVKLYFTNPMLKKQFKIGQEEKIKKDFYNTDIPFHKFPKMFSMPRPTIVALFDEKEMETRKKRLIQARRKLKNSV